MLTKTKKSDIISMYLFQALIHGGVKVSTGIVKRDKRAEAHAFFKTCKT